MGLIINTIFLFILQFIQSVLSADDEFEEIPQRVVESSEEAVKQLSQAEEIEKYKNLTLFGKLHFQLHRSGDISGKYIFLIILIYFR